MDPIETEEECPQCGKNIHSIVDKGVYIYEVCEPCRIIRCPPLSGWSEYETIDEWATDFQAANPPSV